MFLLKKKLDNLVSRICMLLMHEALHLQKHVLLSINRLTLEMLSSWWCGVWINMPIHASFTQEDNKFYGFCKIKSFLKYLSACDSSVIPKNVSFYKRNSIKSNVKFIHWKKKTFNGYYQWNLPNGWIGILDIFNFGMFIAIVFSTFFSQRKYLIYSLNRHSYYPR